MSLIEAAPEAPRGEARSMSRRQLSGLSTSLGILTAIAIGAVAFAMKDIVVPTLFAFLLALALKPVAVTLERLKIPPALAAAVTVVFASAVIGAVVFVAAPMFSKFIDDAPQLMQKLEQRVRPLQATLEEVSSATESIGTMVSPDRNSNVQTVKIASTSTTVTALRIIPTVLAQFFYAAVLAAFILAGRNSYRLKLIAARQTMPERCRMARIIRDIGEKVSGYLFVISAINIFNGVAVSVAFAVLGLPDPILWGVAFGLANFVPFIGSTAVIVASALAGLATEDSLLAAMTGPLVLFAINMFEGNVLQPLLLARRTVVNPLAIVVSFGLFAWMWGPVATVLAVPVIVCFAVIARHTPGLSALAVVLTNEEPQRGRLVEMLRNARASKAQSVSGNRRAPTGSERRAAMRRDRRRALPPVQGTTTGAPPECA